MVFYFSGTGNTLWAASQIARITGDRLVCIPEVTGQANFTLATDERIGFCFPVHGWRPPKIVHDFIHRLRIRNVSDHFCYILCTTGDNTGETIDIFEKDLATIGIKAHSAFSLIMPESYVGLPFMDVDTPQKELMKKEKAISDLNKYATHILNRDIGIRMLTIGRWPRTNSRIIGRIFHKYIVSDKPFHVDHNKCIKCGKCARLCPVNDIKGGSGTIPQWVHNGKCLTCFSCYHHCPVKAIEYGHRTKNKGQYWYGHNNK